MAATTITKLSDELVANTYPAYAPLPPNRSGGRLRTGNFTLTLASEASATSFGVLRIPAGARLITGSIIASATLANSATIAVGLAAIDASGVIHRGTSGGKNTDGTTVSADVSDAVALLKAAAALGATATAFLLTQALGYLYKTDKEVYLTLTTGTGAVTTEVITGHITYVVD